MPDTIPFCLVFALTGLVLNFWTRLGGLLALFDSVLSLVSCASVLARPSVYEKPWVGIFLPNINAFRIVGFYYESQSYPNGKWLP